MKILLVTIGVVVITASLSFIAMQEDPWKVPEKYQNLKNPVLADEASIASGKEIYDTYCVSCHGKDGKGSGRRAVKLSSPPANFTSESFQKQSDGALLYKIYSGHRDMPGFDKKIPGTHDAMEGGFGKTRMPGDLVNYVRVFGNK
ncbi:MAG TPA: cytochrome c [Chitinophagaceae bacterium]|nr:cytochrome c [Chitinophagaceae bacterium]